MSDYAEQIRAFFHYSLKHIFEIEFGIRTVIYLLLCLLATYFLLKIFYKLVRIAAKHAAILARFFFYDAVLPFSIIIVDKLAAAMESKRWQNRADKLRAIARIHDDSDNVGFPKKAREKNKPLHLIYVMGSVLLWLYLLSFHYLLPQLKSDYEFFFMPENALISFEYKLVHDVFQTDEDAIPCIYCNIEGESESEDNEPNFFDDNGFVFSDSDIRNLSRDEIENKIALGVECLKNEKLIVLQFMINEIYARHGARFFNEPYLSHYERYEWYLPKILIDDAPPYFTSYEQRNIRLMAGIREELRAE